MTLKEKNTAEQKRSGTSVPAESLGGFLAAGRLFTLYGRCLSDGDDEPVTDRQLRELLANEGLVLAEENGEEPLILSEAPGPDGLPVLSAEPMTEEDLLRRLMPELTVKRPGLAAKIRHRLKKMRGKKGDQAVRRYELAEILLDRIAFRRHKDHDGSARKKPGTLLWERQTLTAFLAENQMGNTWEEARIDACLALEPVQTFLDVCARRELGQAVSEETVREEEARVRESLRSFPPKEDTDREETAEPFWVEMPEVPDRWQEAANLWERIAGQETEKIMDRLTEVLTAPEDQLFLERVEDILEDPDAREIRGLMADMKDETLHALSDTVRRDPSFDLEGILQNVAQREKKAPEAAENASGGSGTVIRADKKAEKAPEKPEAGPLIKSGPPSR